MVGNVYNVVVFYVGQRRKSAGCFTKIKDFFIVFFSQVGSRLRVSNAQIMIFRDEKHYH